MNRMTSGFPWLHQTRQDVDLPGLQVGICEKWKLLKRLWSVCVDLLSKLGYHLDLI